MLRSRSLRRVAPAALITFILVGLGLISGCSSDAGGRVPEEVPSVDADAVRRACEPYLAEFDRCLRTMAPADLAEQRVSTVRASLEARLSDPAGRAAVLDTCTRGLSQLRDACR